MRDDLKFALVLRAGSKGLAPACPFDFGICFVEGEKARTSFVDFESLSHALGDFPTVPSVYGKNPGIVSYEVEMEAVDALVTATEAFSSKYSHALHQSFSKLREKLDGGLIVTVTNGRIGFEIAQWATEALSWHVGDRVDLAASSDGASFAIIADRDGTSLVDAGRPGWISTVRDWPLPTHSNVPSGEHCVPVSIADGTIVFEFMPQETRIYDVSAPVAAVLPLPHRLPIDYRWGPIALAVVYAAVSITLKVI
jgi:hypothetical protein